MRWALVVAIAACGRGRFDVVGTDAPGSTSDGASAMHLFESGFECAMGPWQKTGNVMVVGAPPTPIEGNCMLEAQAQSSTSSRGEVDMPRTITSGAFYVRAYYYIPSGFALNDFSMLELDQLPGKNLVLISSPYMSLYDDYDPASSAEGTYQIPRDVWSCVEVRVGLGNGGTGTWDIWVDGVLRQSLTGINTFDGGINRITIGITWAGATQAASTDYVDAVVADTAPIGCL